MYCISFYLPCQFKVTHIYDKAPLDSLVCQYLNLSLSILVFIICTLDGANQTCVCVLTTVTA